MTTIHTIAKHLRTLSYEYLSIEEETGATDAAVEVTDRVGVTLATFGGRVSITRITGNGDQMKWVFSKEYRPTDSGWLAELDKQLAIAGGEGPLKE